MKPVALCYNFTRVINILGFERFVACMVATFAFARSALWQPSCTAFSSFWAHSGQKSPSLGSRLRTFPVG